MVQRLTTLSDLEKAIESLRDDDSSHIAKYQVLGDNWEAFYYCMTQHEIVGYRLGQDYLVLEPMEIFIGEDFNYS